MDSRHLQMSENLGPRHSYWLFYYPTDRFTV